MTEFDDRPVRAAVGLAGATAGLSLVLAGFGPVIGVVLGSLGFVALVFGASRGERGPLLVGATLLFLGHLLGAAAGAEPLLALVGAALALVAWDVGEHGVDLGTVVGRTGRSRSAVVTHASVSLSVAGLAVGVGFGIYAVAPGGRPTAALGLLVLGAVLVVVGLRD
ncbi:MAG: hypothetical protein ABEJ67_04900 [Halanaeroarchaeum sp.]